MAGQMALLGAGETGSAWAARFALMGWHVRVFDPEPGAKARVGAAMQAARAGLPALYDIALPPAGAITYPDSLAEAVTGADWVQEALPDRMALKQKMLQAVQASLGEGAVIAGGSETLSADELQTCAPRPGQVVAVAGLAPVWLMPGVLIAGGSKTGPEVIDRAEEVLRQIGMDPIRGASDSPLSAEWEAHETPELTRAMAPIWAAGEAVEARVAILRALKSRNTSGPGQVLAVHEATLAPATPDLTEVPVTLDRQVPPDWVDYNGHMNEAHYLTAFSNAADRLLLWAGMDADCVAEGHSVFTVETHIRHLGEVDIGDRIKVTTRVLDGAGKRLHIWHEMWNGQVLAATGEQLLLHVDLNTRRPAPPRADVGAVLSAAAEAHRALPMPKGVGRHVDAPRN